MMLKDWLENNGFVVIEDEFILDNTTIASIPFFERTFWPALKNAIDSGSSLYDAVMEVDAGTKGWKKYFDEWKEKGILI